jgi:hypothetical protein
MSNDKIRVGIIEAGAGPNTATFQLCKRWSSLRSSRSPAGSKRPQTKPPQNSAFPMPLETNRHSSTILTCCRGGSRSRTRATGKSRHRSRQGCLQRVAADHEHCRVGRAAGIGRSKGREAHRRPATPHGTECPLHARPGDARLRREDSRCAHDGQRGCLCPRMSKKHSWAFDAASFSNVLSIYAAHFGDMLFRSVGFPKKLTAVVETQFPFFTVVETGEQIPVRRGSA